MTFVVNQDGVVYEKDMGPKTRITAKSMREYTLSGSQKSDGQEQQTAEKASE